MPALPPSQIPYEEKRLQSVNTHRQHMETGAYPENRKMLMQAHAKRAAQFEYLQPGGEQAKFDFNGLPPLGKRVHSVYDSVERESRAKESTVRMVMMDGRWRMMSGP